MSLHAVLNILHAHSFLSHGAFSLVLEAVQLPSCGHHHQQSSRFLHSVLIPNVCAHCRPQKVFALGIQRQENSQRKEGI